MKSEGSSQSQKLLIPVPMREHEHELSGHSFRDSKNGGFCFSPAAASLRLSFCFDGKLLLPSVCDVDMCV